LCLVGVGEACGISRVLSPASRGRIISLGPTLPPGSSDLPGTRMERAAPRPCLVLLRVGFAKRSPLPGTRCALTAPFHPCLCPGGPSAVCSLWHFPSAFAARALPGTLPFGARTFLQRSGRARPMAILTRTSPVSLHPRPGSRQGTTAGTPHRARIRYPLRDPKYRGRSGTGVRTGRVARYRTRYRTQTETPWCPRGRERNETPATPDPEPGYAPEPLRPIRAPFPGGHPRGSVGARRGMGAADGSRPRTKRIAVPPGCSGTPPAPS